MDDTCARCGQHVIPKKSTIYRGHQLCSDCFSGISRHANALIGLGTLVVVAGASVMLSSKLTLGKWPWHVAWEHLTQEALPVSRGMRQTGQYLRAVFTLFVPVVLFALNLIPVLGALAAAGGLVKRLSLRRTLRTMDRA